MDSVKVNLRLSPEWGTKQGFPRLVDGHDRIAIARERYGPDTEIPVTYLDLSPDEEAEMLALFDQTTAMATVDGQILDDLLQSFTSADAHVTAYLAELGQRQDEGSGPPPRENDWTLEADEAEARWRVQPGDLWLLPSVSVPGQTHRLLCGDALAPEQADRLLGGCRPVLLLADPPYNLAMSYGHGIDDNQDDARYASFSRSWLTLWQRCTDRQIVTPGAHNLWNWMRWFPEPAYVAPWLKVNATTHGIVSRFWTSEPVLFIAEDPVEWILYFGDGWKRRRHSDIFDHPIGQQQGVGDHPCPKSLALWEDLIQSYTDADELVADPFLGAGTTLLAAERSGRLCYGMELSPRWCAVSLQRLADAGCVPRKV